MSCAINAGQFKVSEDQIADEIVNQAGILTHVATALGVSRTTVHHRIKECERLQEVRDTAWMSLFNAAEGELQLAIDDGEVWAILFTLNTLGRVEGFGPPLPPPRPSKKAQVGNSGDRQGANKQPVVEQTEQLVLMDLDEPRGQIVDSAHRNLLHSVKAGEPWAIKYCLRTLGSAYGYGSSRSLMRAETQHSETAADSSVSAATEGQPGEPHARRLSESDGLPGAQTDEGAQTPRARTLDAAESAGDPAPGVDGAQTAGSAHINPPNMEPALHQAKAAAQTCSTASTHRAPDRRADKRRADKRQERKLRKERVRENRRRSR